MRLTVLGSNGPFASDGEACSSYLLETEDKTLLIDFGNGSLSKLLSLLPEKWPDAIILSHLHHDHISDAFLFRYALPSLLKKYEGKKAPALYLPSSPEREAAQLTEGSLFLKTVFVSDGRTEKEGDTSLHFLKVRHPVESYAVSVRDGSGKRFVYSGDTLVTDGLLTLADGADLFLADGGLLKENWFDGAPHMSVSQAAQAGKRAKQCVITHHSPLSDREKIRAQAGKEALIAERGMTVEF